VRSGPGPRILEVVADDLCIACGACIHACPEDVVEPFYDRGRGAHEVRVTDAKSCVPCPAPCDDVCPSIRVDLLGLLGGDAPAVLDRVGPVESIHLGHAPQHQWNGVSSSGGVIRAFVADALRRGVPVIALAQQEASEGAGSGEGGYAPALLESSDELSRLPGSIYHGVSFTRCIGLLRGLRRPCLLVCTPCQLEGIRAYLRRCEPGLEAKLGLVVGLICGWMYSDHALSAFAFQKGIGAPLIDAGYRGESQVGLLKLVTAEGTAAFDRRRFDDFAAELDYRSSFGAPMNRLRCRLCQDHLNVLADVAVGDAWLRRTGGRKLSLVVTRTPRGRDALAALADAGLVVLERAAAGDLRESQSDDLVDGESARKLAAFLAERGVVAPRFEFGAADPEPALARVDRWRLRFELVLRALARGRRYRLYRWLYLARQPKPLRRLVPGVAWRALGVARRLGSRLRRSRRTAGPRILVSGLCLQGNKGGPAIALSLMQQIRVHRPEARFRFCVPQGDLAYELPWARRYGVDVVEDFQPSDLGGLGLRRGPAQQRARLRRVAGFLAALWRADVLLEMSAISYVGPPVGTEAGVLTSRRVRHGALARRLRKPVIAWTQSYGPFSTPRIRELARRDLGAQKLVLCRGEESAAQVRELLPGQPIRCFPDVAVVLEHDPAFGEDYCHALFGSGDLGRLVTLSPSAVLHARTPSPQGPSGHVRQMAELCRRLEARGQPVLLVPHTHRPGRPDPRVCDTAVCREILDALGRDSGVELVREDFSPAELKSIISAAAVHVSGRYHGLVAALSSGVPCVALSWHHKYRDLMRVYEMEDFVCDGVADDVAGACLDRIDKLLASPSELRRRLQRAQARAEAQVAKNTRLVVEWLEEVTR